MIRPRLAPSRPLVQRALGAVVVAAVLITAMLSGRSYLWCLVMEQPMQACCCHAPGDAGSSEPTDAVRSACCETRSVAALPTAERARAASVSVPPPMAALLVDAEPPGIANLAAPRSPVRPVARRAPIRAGPASAAASCVRLQVFRC